MYAEAINKKQIKEKISEIIRLLDYFESNDEGYKAVLESANELHRTINREYIP